MGSQRYGPMGRREGPKCDGGPGERRRRYAAMDKLGTDVYNRTMEMVGGIGRLSRRGPVRACTEELGIPQTEGEEGPPPGTEIAEGVTERNNELIDRTKGQN